MPTMSDPKSLAERLTQEQRDHLAGVASSISHEGLTTSFSLEGRDTLTGMKKSCFLSLKVARGDGQGPGWVQEDMRLVRCLLSKEVVAAVYDDAVRRRMMDPPEATERLRPILAAYDSQIVKILEANSANQS